MLLILYHKPLDPDDFAWSEAVTPLQADGIKPEFRFAVFTLDMDVCRFVSVARVEKESVGPASVYGRHPFIVRSQAAGGNHESRLP